MLELFRQFGDSEREQWLVFGEFLRSRQAPRQEALPEPDLLPRPRQESVIAAIKRLSASYPMLDKAAMLNDTSALVSQHMLQGREADAVIDELEAVFERHYAYFKQKYEESQS